MSPVPRKSVFIHPFFSQTFTEGVCYTKLCARHWGLRDERGSSALRGRIRVQHGGCGDRSLDRQVEKLPVWGAEEGLGRLPGSDPQGDENAQGSGQWEGQRKKAKQTKTQLRPKARGSLLMGTMAGVGGCGS